MDIKLDGAGRVVHQIPQLAWFDRDGDGALMLTCRVAGQEMMAIVGDDEKTFDLHFMGHMTGGFASMELAKRSSLQFALEVLELHINIVNQLINSGK